MFIVLGSKMEHLGQDVFLGKQLGEVQRESDGIQYSFCFSHLTIKTDKVSTVILYNFKNWAFTNYFEILRPAKRC